MQLLKNKKGISLIEIMVVVGLMTVITAIAVPNYIAYQRQARTTEAQSSLSQIYMAEKSFHLQWRFYTTDLVSIGVHPDGKLLYNAGFSAKYSDAEPKSYRGPTLDLDNKDLNTICGTTFGAGEVKTCAFRPPKKGTHCASFAPPALPTTPSSTASNAGFNAMAVANLLDICNKSSSGGLDVWKIDQYKQLDRCRDGTRTSSATIDCP